MKVLGVIALIAIIFAVASSGPGVPALNPGNVNTDPFSVSDGNNSITHGAGVGGEGLNPAHGKPGHRCDIAVGQPLNGKSATQPGQVNNSLPILNPPGAAPAEPFAVPALNSANALNPPHGKPGHRCDIKVGDPLDSKPAETSTTPAIAPTLNVPAVVPKVNPAHGQPGHRCEIKVGDPL